MIIDSIWSIIKENDNLLFNWKRLYPKINKLSLNEAESKEIENFYQFDFKKNLSNSKKIINLSKETFLIELKKMILIQINEPHKLFSLKREKYEYFVIFNKSSIQNSDIIWNTCDKEFSDCIDKELKYYLENIKIENKILIDFKVRVIDSKYFIEIQKHNQLLYKYITRDFINNLKVINRPLRIQKDFELFFINICNDEDFIDLIFLKENYFANFHVKLIKKSTIILSKKMEKIFKEFNSKISFKQFKKNMIHELGDQFDDYVSIMTKANFFKIIILMFYQNDVLFNKINNFLKEDNIYQFIHFYIALIISFDYFSKFSKHKLLKFEKNNFITVYAGFSLSEQDYNSYKDKEYFLSYSNEFILASLNKDSAIINAENYSKPRRVLFEININIHDSQDFIYLDENISNITNNNEILIKNNSILQIYKLENKIINEKQYGIFSANLLSFGYIGIFQFFKYDKLIDSVQLRSYLEYNNFSNLKDICELISETNHLNSINLGNLCLSNKKDTNILTKITDSLKKNNKIKTIQLYENKLDFFCKENNQIFKNICEFIQNNTNLQFLNLGSNDLGNLFIEEPELMKEFFEILKINKTIDSLLLFDNKFSLILKEENKEPKLTIMNYICQLIVHNKNIKHLNLAGNNLGNFFFDNVDLMKEFLEAIENNFILKDLNFYNNDIIKYEENYLSVADLKQLYESIFINQKIDILYD